MEASPSGVAPRGTPLEALPRPHGPRGGAGKAPPRRRSPARRPPRGPEPSFPTGGRLSWGNGGGSRPPASMATRTGPGGADACAGQGRGPQAGPGFVLPTGGLPCSMMSCVHGITPEGPFLPPRSVPSGAPLAPASGPLGPEARARGDPTGGRSADGVGTGGPQEAPRIPGMPRTPPWTPIAGDLGGSGPLLRPPSGAALGGWAPPMGSARSGGSPERPSPGRGCPPDAAPRGPTTPLRPEGRARQGGVATGAEVPSLTRLRAGDVPIVGVGPDPRRVSGPGREGVRVPLDGLSGLGDPKARNAVQGPAPAPVALGGGRGARTPPGDPAVAAFRDTSAMGRGRAGSARPVRGAARLRQGVRGNGDEARVLHTQDATRPRSVAPTDGPAGARVPPATGMVPLAGSIGKGGGRGHHVPQPARRSSAARRPRRRAPGPALTPPPRRRRARGGRVSGRPQRPLRLRGVRGPKGPSGLGAGGAGVRGHGPGP